MANSDESNEDDRDLRAVAARIRAVRQKYGFTQPEFAEQLGYSRRQYINWENGDATPPIWALRAIRRIFDISPDWILSGPGLVPVSHPTRLPWERYDRLIADVRTMVDDVGLELADDQIADLARLLFEEAPESEHEARKKMLRVLRAISLDRPLK